MERVVKRARVQLLLVYILPIMVRHRNLHSSWFPRGRGMAVGHTSIGHGYFSIVLRRAHGRGEQRRVSFEQLFLAEKPFRLSVAFAPSSLERCCGASTCMVSNDIANCNSCGDEIEREERDHA